MSTARAAGTGRIADMLTSQRSRYVSDFGRIAPFMDAVVAVALTALALPLLDVKINESGTWSSFWSEYGSQFLAFFSGFLTIIIYWVIHHKVWGTVHRCPRGLLWLNVLWLLGIVLIPFGTVVLNENGGQAPILGAEIFCAIMILTALPLGLIIYVVTNDPELSDSELIPVPLWWNMRLSAWWAVVWIALVVNSALGIRFLELGVVVLGVLSALPAPGRKRAPEEGKAQQGGSS